MGRAAIKNHRNHAKRFPGINLLFKTTVSSRVHASLTIAARWVEFLARNRGSSHSANEMFVFLDVVVVDTR